MRKKKDLSLDELIAQLVRFAEKLEKDTGGRMGFEMRFSPAPKPAKKKTTP